MSSSTRSSCSSSGDCSGQVKPLQLAILTPHDVWTSHRLGSSHRPTFQSALEAAVAEELGGVNVSYIWRDIGRKQSLPAAQALFRQNADLEVVLSPSFHPPFRTVYYTRRGGIDGSGAVKIKSTAVTIPPYANAFNAAAGLCHHFGWRNVVLMNSDDHFMGLAQVFRQRLGEESVVIRSHTIISSALADEVPTESGNPSSKVQFDLEAIRASGVRVIFLMASCRSYHVILTAARQMNMLRGYAWVLLEPQTICHIGLTDRLGALDVLETYQGVLGLVWDEAGGAYQENRLAMPTSDAAHDAASPDSHFLYQSVMLYAKAREQGRELNLLGSVEDYQDFRQEGPPEESSMGVGIISISGARKLSVGYNQPQSDLQILYQMVGILVSSMDTPKVAVSSARPIRWPGDVYVQPRDLEPRHVGGGHLGGPSSSYHGRSSSYTMGYLGEDLGTLALVVFCLCLHPLYLWLAKVFHRKVPPPCVGPGVAKMSVRSLPDNRETREYSMSLLEQELSKLSERQMEVLRAMEVDVKSIQIKGMIGAGSFSQVYKGYFQNSHVAVKVLKSIDTKNVKRYLEEIVLHKDLRHPNIVPFRGASWSDGRPLMVVDFAGRGTLADVLRRSCNTLKWKTVKLNMAIGIAQGMAFLHQSRYYDMWTGSYKECIVHRDLKPQNLLVTDSYHVQITDFGEARTLDRDEDFMTQVGTQVYVAPEVVKGERYSEKCDVYSFAVVMLAMLELKPDVLDVFAEGLPDVERFETGITEDGLKEPDVEASDACKTCPLNRVEHAHPPPATISDQEISCPMAKHKEFKGVVAHAVTRAVVYDEMRPKLPSTVLPSLRNLITSCWRVEPSERWSFTEIVKYIESDVRQEVTEYVPRSNKEKLSEHHQLVDTPRRLNGQIQSGRSPFLAPARGVKQSPF